MNKYLKKFGIMFVMTLILSLGFCISAFADDTSQSIKINNTTLNFNKIIYIDGTNGSDTTGDGSQLNPFNTLSKATSTVDTDNTLIYILTPGTYASPKGLQGLLSSSYTLTYATPSSNFGQVTLDLKTTGSNVNMGMSKLNKFIGLNFIRSTGGDNRTFEYFYDGAAINLEFDNCTFLKSPAITNPLANIFTGNSGGCKVTELTYNNCSFLQHMSCADSNYGIANRHTSVNSAFIDSDTTPKAFNLFNAQFDENYNITSNGWKNTGTGTNPDGTQANIGVYGGEFAWGEWNSKDESISLDKSSMDLTVGDSGQLTETTTPSAVSVTWSSSDSSIATVDSNGKVTAIGIGTATITATTTDGSNLSASCAVNVTANSGGNNGGTTTGASAIVNIAYAKGDNTNNAGGDVSIIFNGVPDTTLSVVKTASVKSVWVGDTFTYTIAVTNTGSKTAKAVVINDSAPNHIQFMPSGITTTQGTVDPSSSASNIVVNVGDIPPSGTVTITVPATVVL